MATTLRLSPDFSLPIDAVTQTFAILAKRGVGKTYTASVLVEEFLKAGLHAVIADPVGVWWGLRASADGQRPGLPIVILGGDHCDAPLEVNSGEIIADVIVDERLPVVLDLSHFRKGEQTKFMTDFAERLYHRNRQPLHLVLDEADAFAPQRPMKGQERMLGAVEDLVRRGRARGIGVTLVTQRSAVLNKDVLTQIEVLVALRTIAPQDREAIDAWVKVHGTAVQREELMQSLPTLPVGTAWFWSPGWLNVFQRVNVRKRETFDSSATPTVGRNIQPPKQLAEVDIAKLRERIAATIAQVEAEDPRVLMKRISELEGQLAGRSETPKPIIERIEVPVIKDTQIDRIEETVSTLAEVGAKLVRIADELKPILSRVTKQSSAQAAPSKRLTVSRTSSDAPVVPPSSPTGKVDVDELKLRAGERKILEVLGQYYPKKFSRRQLGTLSRFTPSSGTFGTYLRTLKRHGLIVADLGGIQITQAGIDYAGISVPTQPQTIDELLEMWQKVLRLGERQMLGELVTTYPSTLTREELGERTGYVATSGTFGAYLRILRRNGLIEVNGREVRASDTLFLAGSQVATPGRPTPGKNRTTRVGGNTSNLERERP